MQKQTTQLYLKSTKPTKNESSLQKRRNLDVNFHVGEFNGPVQLINFKEFYFEGDLVRFFAGLTRQLAISTWSSK